MKFKEINIKETNYKTNIISINDIVLGEVYEHNDLKLSKKYILDNKITKERILVNNNEEAINILKDSIIELFNKIFE